MLKYYLIYLLIINIVAFFMYGIDKRKAVKHKWRVSEKNLILVAALGGFVGAWLGMILFRHKTKHLKFKLGIPAITVIYIAGFVFVMLWKG